MKTAILYFIQDQTKKNPAFVEENLADICASIQHRIVTILLNKFSLAAQETGIHRLCIAGGVAANSGLRTAFLEMGKTRGWQTSIPAFEYCTDNAAMIAITGYHKFLAKDFSSLETAASARD